VDQPSIQLGPGPIDTDQLILIVTGAHLRAEVGDRPIAYRLQGAILQWLARNAPDSSLVPLVCSDIWYLNDDDLRSRPTISIGGPGVNALAAFLTDKLPSAFSIEGVLTVQMDLDFVELVCSCWGMGTAPTVNAVDAWIEKYMEVFLEHVVSRADA
jgi:hypothetical protein